METIKRKLSICPNAKALITIVDLEEETRKVYCVELNEIDPLYSLQNDLALFYDDVSCLEFKECKNVGENVNRIVYIDEDVEYSLKFPDLEGIEFFDEDYALEKEWLRSITYNNTTYYFTDCYNRADVFDYIFYDNHRNLNEKEFLFAEAHTWLL